MNTVGVVGTLLGEEPNLYFLEIFAGVIQAATAAGQTTTVFTLNDWHEAEHRVPLLCDGRIDGLIMLAPMLTTTADAWLPAHTPIVSIHANCELAGVVNLETDDEAGACRMVAHLLQLGHRRILHIGGPVGSVGAERRVEGYLRAHAEAGVRCRVDDVVRTAFSYEGGRRAMEDWLQGHRGEPLPHAVFGANDAIALGAVDTLRARGLQVPADLSVVGFDNTVLARTARLATVRQPLRELGERALQALVARIEGRRKGGQGEAAETAETIVLRTDIVAGLTLAAPRTTPLQID
ncbi:MAG: LacI family transcriptional regulator [Rubrivivax sp.]|nr:MAG: LacI family transcriptional regulator [Rubrivivax sp.]